MKMNLGIIDYGFCNINSVVSACKKDENGNWILNNPIWEQEEYFFNDDDETFSDKYKHLYFNENNPPTKTGKPILDNSPIDFEWT